MIEQVRGMVGGPLNDADTRAAAGQPIDDIALRKGGKFLKVGFFAQKGRGSPQQGKHRDRFVGKPLNAGSEGVVFFVDEEVGELWRNHGR